MLPPPLEREGFNFMSTNQTASYGLHLWEPGDHFLREEFNENFAALDSAARFTAGSYIGDGAESRFISLGFTPTAVLVVSQHGDMGGGYTYYGGLALEGHPVQDGTSVVVQVAAAGFTVRSYQISASYHAASNGKGVVYHYLALR